MLGYGSPVRIPPPPKKAGFRDRWRRRSRTGGKGGGRIRLRGTQAGTRRLRQDIHDEATLYRSWVRWSMLSVLWLTLGAGMYLFPASRFSVPHFGLIVVFAVSFFASFHRAAAARVTASVLILLVAGMFAALGEVPEVAIGMGLPGLGLFLLNSFRL